jgi:hypothetical protein
MIEKIKWVAIIMLFMIDVVVFYAGYQMGGHKARLDASIIVNTCIEDLQSNCSKIRAYATLLENENARIINTYKGD